MRANRWANHSRILLLRGLFSHCSSVMGSDFSRSCANIFSISTAKPLLKITAFTSLLLEKLWKSIFVDPTVDQTLVEEDGIWLGEEKTEIVLKISSEVAGYFKRRKLIANQVIEKELEDGGLIVSAKVGHPNQVLPIVRYWIPHIRIISPEGLQGELESELARYLDGASAMIHPQSAKQLASRKADS